MYYSRERIAARLKRGTPLVYDFTRRTDPGFIPEVWDNLRDALSLATPHVLHVWTKWPALVMERGKKILEALRKNGVVLAAQVTVNLHGSLLEPRIPDDPHLLGVKEFASLMGGPGHVTWRFDPLIPSVPFEDRVLRAAEFMAGMGVRRMVVNTIAPPGRYARVDARLRGVWEWWSPERFGLSPEQAKKGKYAPSPLELADESTWNGWARWQRDAVARVVELVRPLGFEIHACAETAWLHGVVDGLGPAGCASPQWFSSLGAPQVPVRPTRPGCGCADTVDLGSYGHWSRCGRCLYCYAG